MIRVRYSREQWLIWIDEQAASGLSVVQFCKERALPQQSFYNWRAKLMKADTATAQNSALFVPLRIGALDQLQVDMPCGAKLRVPSDQVSQVVTLLHRLGGAS